MNRVQAIAVTGTAMGSSVTDVGSNTISPGHVVEALTPPADELAHLRGLASWMVQTALLSGEAQEASFHDFVLRARVDPLSISDEARYELVMFSVHRAGVAVEQANYLRRVPHDPNAQVHALLDVMADCEQYRLTRKSDALALLSVPSIH
jgi:hypothetical protein